MRDAVLMPVYNEASTVGHVLDSVRAFYAGEVIVIDDGSTDETPRVLAQRSDAAVVRLDCNCGYGCALRIGFDVARELGVSRLVTMDCDGQHEPAHIPQFLTALDDGPEIVSGSRYLPESGSVGSAPRDRREINARVTAKVNEVTGWGLTDAFCGFKAYRVEALGRLVLTEPGYAMPVERIYCDRDRSFGASLDDPEKRFDYYLDVWSRALEVE